MDELRGTHFSQQPTAKEEGELGAICTCMQGLQTLPRCAEFTSIQAHLGTAHMLTISRASWAWGMYF